MEPDLFYAGQRPAINVGLSVSRVGGAAQIKAIKQVAGKLRLDLAQYRSLAAFAQFSSDLDEATKKQIDRGARMVELLKQPQFIPMPVSLQAVLLWVGSNGHLDDIAVEEIGRFEKDFLAVMEDRQSKILSSIAKEKMILPDTEKKLKEVVAAFKQKFQPKE